jgi:hypothetical protein
MRKCACALLAVALASPAVGVKFTMQLAPTSQQQSRMQSGVAAVDDTSPGSSIRFIQTEGDLKKRGSIELIVMNHADKPFNFGPENVSATLADGTPVQMITYDQLVHEEKRRQMWSAVAAGLAAAGNSMSAANAGYYHGTTTYNGSTYGSVGGTSFNATTYGSGTYSGYNAGQAALAQSVANAQNQATFARMAETNVSSMEALKGNIRTTTVDPQQMFGGSVMFELPKQARGSKVDVPVTFVVTINGEEHRFDALLKRR